MEKRTHKGRTSEAPTKNKTTCKNTSALSNVTS